MTDHNIEVLARRLINIDAQIDELQKKRKEIAGKITDAIEVGGAVDVAGHTYYRVQQRRTFSVHLRQVVGQQSARLEAQARTLAAVREVSGAEADVWPGPYGSGYQRGWADALDGVESALDGGAE